MSAAAIEAPYTIASLPKPLDGSYGRIRTAPVYSIRDSRKRKRHEIVVGIDGECVNIYNIQSQRLIASYALPPQSYLCCPPCSIYIQATNSFPALRKTFMVVKDKLRDSKLRLVCFSENVRSNKDADVHDITPERTECSLGDGDMSGLDVVPAGSQSASIVASYASGDTYLVSSNLESLKKIHLPQAGDGDELQYAAALDIDVAKKGLLRHREDVLAILGQITSSGLLCNILRVHNETLLRLYSIRSPTQTSLQTASPGVQLLMEHKLPRQQDTANSHAHFELHPASGMLYELAHGVLHVYDLSGTTPKFITELGSHSAPISGFARVSSLLAMTASSTAASLYETKYGSLYGSVSTLAPANAAMQGKKRKRESESSEQLLPLEQLHSLSDVGPVVALRGHELVVLQLSETLKANKRSQAQGVRLADVFSRRQADHTDGKAVNKKQRKGWESWTADVDRMLETDDIEGLENLVANDPQLGLQRAGKIDWDDDQPDGISDGDKIAYEELWPLPETFDPSKLDWRRGLYILGKMFDNGEDGVGIRILSLKLLEWLALAGLLSAQNLRKAWNEMGEGESATEKSPVPPGAILSAIEPYDDDFQMLRDLLTLPVHWEIEEVIEALLAVVHSFDDLADGEQGQLLLPAIPHHAYGDVKMANGDLTNGDLDSQVEFEAEAAEREINHAQSILAEGQQVKSELLRSIFHRLLAFDTHTITTKLRSMMSHKELIFFIHMLRIELADGGWTSRYISVDGNEDEEEEQGLVNAKEGAEEGGPSDAALKTIGDLLNCAVDAIGTNGWLVGLSGATVPAQELLASLKAEVSAGLEQCYEADSLGTALGEIERFAAQAGKDLLDEMRAVGDLIGENGGDAVMLPVGGRAYPAMVDGRKGKSATKSKIALAQEKSRRVGKYSFDRIRI